jgi:protein-tyrosine phosphatase
MAKEIMALKQLLPLEGAINFRDMGGLKTLDGRKVKDGILFRAGELSGLTASDIAYLENLQIKHIFDYRSDFEAAVKPDPEIHQVKNVRIPVYNEATFANSVVDGHAPEDYFKHLTKERFIELYSKMPIQNQSYKGLMHLVKKPEENFPLVHHCTGGRDRTGIGAMLILLTLDVPIETVFDDFLLSNDTLKDYHESLFKEAEKYLSTKEVESFKDAMLLNEDYLESSLNAIMNTYGSFNNYLLEEFNINEALRNEIKDYCLE